MSHSPQFKIKALLPILGLLMVFCVTTPSFADTPHHHDTTQGTTASPQVTPTPVPPPTATSTQDSTPSSTSNSTPQNATTQNSTTQNPAPVEQSIYSDLAQLAAQQHRQNSATTQPVVSKTVQQPTAVFPPVTPVASMKTGATTHVLSYFPFINTFSPSANAYDTSTGFDPRTTKLLTMTSYGMILAGIALVLIKPKSIALSSTSFKKPVSSI